MLFKSALHFTERRVSRVSFFFLSLEKCRKEALCTVALCLEAILETYGRALRTRNTNRQTHPAIRRSNEDNRND